MKFTLTEQTNNTVNTNIDTIKKGLKSTNIDTIKKGLKRIGLVQSGKITKKTVAFSKVRESQGILLEVRERSIV